MKRRIITLTIFIFQCHLLEPFGLAHMISLSPDEQHLSDNYSFKELFALGRKYKVLGEVETAMHFLKAALLKKPFDWAANWDLGDLYLTLGDFKRGMAGFKFRWQHEKQFKEKLWRGEDLQGKTILIYCQWGLGDTFMYIRYAKLLKKLGANVICQSQKPLVSLLRNCSYIDEIITSNDPSPFFDFQVPITYLPEIFNTTIDTIPNDMPYLSVDEKYIHLWAKKLGDKKKFRIGICWQGAVREDPQTIGRAIQLKDLLPLFCLEDAELYSLQQGYGTEQILDLSVDDQNKLHVFDDTFDKSNGAFVDTAAVMKNLDLVLTVDTSIAHLAGALCIPTWVILQYANEWRFFLERTDSPWYPTMRLFRQKKQGDWKTVITQVVNELQRTIIF